jgi:deoxycytidine triphosphate deaminase
MAALSAAEIEARAVEIFMHGTFSKEGLRGACYDLRIRDREDMETTGEVTGGVLKLEKGDRAVVETHEELAMPWNLAGNVGVKARWSLQGLFVTQGLFVDPGFGWQDEGEMCKAHGSRLKLMLTNMGNEPIWIRLGERGDPVLGIQFLPVAEPKVRKAIEERNVDSKALAIFSDISKIEEDMKMVRATAERVDLSTSQVVLFGVFLVTATVFGALIAFLLALASSGDDAARVVHALNELNAARPWTVVVLVAVVLVMVMSLLVISLAACEGYRKLLGRRVDR